MVPCAAETMAPERPIIICSRGSALALAQVVAATFPESSYDPSSCRTNIVAFDHPRARGIVSELAERGVLGGTVSPRRVRLVTHAGVSDDDVTYVGEVMKGWLL